MALLLASAPVHAALLGRDLTAAPGFEAYYDTALDITWQANANLADTVDFGVGGIEADGRMSWNTATAWLAAMNTANYLGFNDWRLPTMVDVGNDGCNFAYTGTDCGYNVLTTAGATVYSEYASLWDDTLGNAPYYNTSGVGPPTSGWSFISNSGPFANMQGFVYWTGLEYGPETSTAWGFGFDYGNQVNFGKADGRFVWGVRSGDVAAIPEAGSVAAAALGLLGMLGARLRWRQLALG